MDMKEKDMTLFNTFCKEYKYTPIILPTKKHVFAIGDLHGDYKLTMDILINVIKVIDNELNWLLSDTYVVQIGDILDGFRPNGTNSSEQTSSEEERGEDIKILELFTELDIKAQKHNSRVISLFGNHELMNVQGNMTYVSHDDILKFSKNNNFEEGKRERIEQFKPGNKYALMMACTKNSTRYHRQFHVCSRRNHKTIYR